MQHIRVELFEISESPFRMKQLPRFCVLITSAVKVKLSGVARLCFQASCWAESLLPLTSLWRQKASRLTVLCCVQQPQTARPSSDVVLIIDSPAEKWSSCWGWHAETNAVKWEWNARRPPSCLLWASSGWVVTSATQLSCLPPSVQVSCFYSPSPQWLKTHLHRGEINGGGSSWATADSILSLFVCVCVCFVCLIPLFWLH